jgi:sulfatase modifying factor 1
MNKAIMVMTLVLLCFGTAAQSDVFNMPTGFTSLDTIVVGNPGNKADDTGYGSVAYPFKMGKFEVTCAQYVEFLNAKTKSDPYGLYDDNVLESDWGFKLERKGKGGAYTYSIESNYENRPIVKITFWDACRFCNWLHNGQGDGDTETGAYTLNGRMDDDKGTVRRNPEAKWFIPSENEWYKAAYYDLSKPIAAKYWNYPTRSNLVPNRDFSGSNSANLNTGALLSPVTTVVGSFGKSDSTCGTFDQDGNVSEWTETVGFLGNKQNRCQRREATVPLAELARIIHQPLIAGTEIGHYLGW